MLARTRTRTHAHAHAHAYKHTHTHTHTSTHTHKHAYNYNYKHKYNFNYNYNFNPQRLSAKQHLQRLPRGCIGVARVLADTHRVMLLVTDGLSQETARLPADFGVLCRDAVFGHLNFQYKALWPDMSIWLCTCSRPCTGQRQRRQ